VRNYIKSILDKGILFLEVVFHVSSIFSRMGDKWGAQPLLSFPVAEVRMYIFL